MNTLTRAMMMPIWDDCPWPVPFAVEVHRDGNLVAFVYAGRSIGVLFDSFDPLNLVEVLARLGVSPVTPPPPPGDSPDPV